MNTLEKNITYTVCILCMLMPQIIPLYTLILLHIWHGMFNSVMRCMPMLHNGLEVDKSVYK